MDFKIIDIIPFNGDIIVELRLKYLFDYVDQFYIIESWYTHSGNKKDSLFTDSEYFSTLFKPYISKINIIIIDEFPKMTQEWFNTKKGYYMTQESYESWYREHYHRNYIYTLNILPIKYIALICDADEIPNIDTITFLKNNYNTLDNNPYYFEMDFYYYNFNWIKKMKWHSAFAVNDTFMNSNHKDLSYYRTYHPKQYVLSNSGWHCSYFYSLKDIVRKIESFAHRECDKETFKDINHCKYCLSSGIDLFNRGDNENLTYTDIFRSSLFNNKFAIDFHIKLLDLQN